MPLDDFEDSGSVVKIVPSPTQKALYALENAITRISNKDKNIDEFHEAVTQKTSNHPSGLDNSIHDLETQINNDLFKSPVIPQKYHQNKTSSIKRTKLFSDHSTTLNSSDLLSLEDFESENLLTNYESPFRENNTFKICKASSSSFKKHKSNIGTLPNSLSVRNISDNYCNDKSRDYEEPQSAFTRISNVNKHLEINKEKSKISSKSNEKKDYSAAYTNCDATILKKYASKYGDNKQKSNASAYEIPTQIIFEKPNVKRASVNELNPFDVPTQKIVPDKPVIPSKSVSPFLERTKNAQIESNNRNVSNDPFLALTQKIPQEKVNSHLIINNSKVSPIKTVNKEDIEKSNVPIDTVTADPFDVPTQVIVSEKSNQIDDKLEKSVILDPFDAPTQICSGKHAESENFNTSSPFIVPVKEFSLKNNQSHTKNLKKSNIFLNKYEKVSKTINSENDEDIPLSEFFRNRNQKNSVSPTSGEKDNSTNHAINVDASLDKEVLLINSSNHELKKTDSVQNNYYNSTMDIENDLLTQPTNAESKSIVPIEVIENNIQSLGIPKEKKNDSNMKENYYVCTQELENDLLSQATTSTPKPIEKIPFKIPKKNSFRTIESRNRPSSPDDFYGCRAVDTPTLKQNCIPSKDVVLAPLEDEIESSSEDVVTPIAYKRKIPKKKLKTTNTKSDVGQLVLKVTLDKMQSQKTLTSKNNESNLAENNLLKNVPSSSKEKLTNDNDLSVNASSNNTVMDTSMSYDPFENYTDPSKPENMSLSLQNNYCENKRKRRTSSFQSTYNVMFSRFRPNELQRFENIIIDLGKKKV